jgi:hypothetical protein
MANLKSILSDIGHGLKKFFGVAVDAAQVAMPFVDVAFPGIGPLYTATVAAAAQAEAASVAAGQQNGTGPQKLAMVVAAIEKEFQDFAAANGIPSVTVKTIENWVNAVVASLNAIPAAQSAAIGQQG